MELKKIEYNLTVCKVESEEKLNCAPSQGQLT